MLHIQQGRPAAPVVRAVGGLAAEFCPRSAAAAAGGVLQRRQQHQQEHSPGGLLPDKPEEGPLQHGRGSHAGKMLQRVALKPALMFGICDASSARQ